MRIQGTDGIRRPTALDDSAQARGLDPLNAFLKAGVITPGFMELYAFCFITDLERLGRFKRDDPIVIGWDPRDPSGHFINAFIRGARKAGASVLSVGILPTPAIPLYMLARGASGAAMITASHNLKDQNGVKLFWARHGLKYLPKDDERLTSVILEVAGSVDLAGLAPLGRLIDESEPALMAFEEFMLREENSWLCPSDSKIADLHLDKLTLVVDAANGCLSNIAGKLFRGWGVDDVVDVNTSLCGDVNEFGGVAALEGTIVIKRADACPDDGPSSPIAEHKAIARLFHLATEMKDDLVSGRRLLSGAVFDADGDRFFRLDYSPQGDAIIVSSGDEAAYVQAQYMAENLPDGAQRRFIHTVESDINVGNFAAQKLGVRPVMTAVGDKWVLFEAFVSQLLGRLSLIEQCLGQGALQDAPQGASERAKSIRGRLNSIMDERSSDSQTYFDIEDEINSMQRDYLTPDQLQSVNHGLLRPGAIPYLVGFEETGHSITAGILSVHEDSYSDGAFIDQLPTANRQLPTNNILFFAGNGLKSAINTLVASQIYLEPSLDVRKLHERLASPFPRGFKRTYYAYYTMKELFVAGASIWDEFADFLEQQCRYRFAADFDIKRREFAEDRDMVFIAITSKGGSEVLASVFARNSGTEEKTGINVRGPSDLAERLDAVGDLARRRLLTNLKSSESPYAKAEKMLLAALHEIGDNGKPILLADAMAMVSRTFPDVVPERLLLEMHKQELLELESLSDPSAVVRISPLGTWHIL